MLGVLTEVDPNSRAGKSPRSEPDYNTQQVAKERVPEEYVKDRHQYYQDAGDEQNDVQHHESEAGLAVPRLTSQSVSQAQCERPSTSSLT